MKKSVIFSEYVMSKDNSLPFYYDKRFHRENENYTYLLNNLLTGIIAREFNTIKNRYLFKSGFIHSDLFTTDKPHTRISSTGIK